MMGHLNASRRARETAVSPCPGINQSRQKEIIEKYHKQNVLIGRRFPPMDTYIRVSLGTPEEMKAFWQAWDTLHLDMPMGH